MANTQPTEEIQFSQLLDGTVSKPAGVKRAALYMRVSTKNHGQTTETQALALRDYAAHRGFNIVEEYRDEGISGSKDSRPGSPHERRQRPQIRFSDRGAVRSVCPVVGRLVSKCTPLISNT
jgi:hypothetical protein